MFTQFAAWTRASIYTIKLFIFHFFKTKKICCHNDSKFRPHTPQTSLQNEAGCTQQFEFVSPFSLHISRHFALLVSCYLNVKSVVWKPKHKKRCVCILAFVYSFPSENTELTQTDIARYFKDKYGLTIKEIDTTIPKYKQSLYEPVLLPSLNIQQPSKVIKKKRFFFCACMRMDKCRQK